MTDISWLITIITVYFVGLAFLSWRAASVRTNVEDARTAQADFFTGSLRPFNAVTMVFTFAATLMSAFFMVGLPGFAYTHGAIVWPFVIFGDVLGVLLLYIVGKKFIQVAEARRASGAPPNSPLEIISKSRLDKLAIFVTLAIFIVPYLGVQISGFGRLMTEAMDGSIPTVAASIGILLVIWIYSSISGLRGVVWSDTLQGALLITLALAVSYTFLNVNFGSVSEYTSAIANNHELLNSPGPAGFGTYPVLFSSMILFASLFISQPQFLTRYISFQGKNPVRNLRRMAFGLSLFLSVLTVPIILLGIGGATIYPDLGGGDQLMGIVIRDHLPIWMAMLFTVAVLAAAMSTADSILFSIGQMFTIDIIGGFFGTNVGQFSTMVIVRLGILLIAIGALVIGLSNNELIVQMSTLSFAGCLQAVPAIVGGLWNPNAWRGTGTISVIVGVVLLFVFNDLPSQMLLGFNPAIPSFVGASVTFLGIDLVRRRLQIKAK